jgi:hypothetical protein
MDYNISQSRAKLKEASRKYQNDELLLKGKERNFQHFLNVEKGTNLHYYRKVDD